MEEKPRKFEILGILRIGKIIAYTGKSEKSGKFEILEEKSMKFGILERKSRKFEILDEKLRKFEKKKKKEILTSFTENVGKFEILEKV